MIQAVRPKPATGQALTCTLADSDYSLTVEARKKYRIQAIDYDIKIGYTSLATAANVLCVIPAGKSVLIEIDTVQTALKYRSADAGASGWMCEVYPD